MKRYFNIYKKVPILFFVFLSLSCVSVEFQPSADYANLQKSKIQNVHLCYAKPSEEFVVLGRLLVYEHSGNVNDPAFAELIKREAKKRGAEGAWITKRTISKVNSFVAQNPSRRGTPPPSDRESTQAVETHLGKVEVLLFNYIQNRSEHQIDSLLK